MWHEAMCGPYLWGEQLCDFLKGIFRFIFIVLNASILFYFVFTSTVDQAGGLWVLVWLFYALSQLVFIEMWWVAGLHTDRRIQPLLG